MITLIVLYLVVAILYCAFIVGALPYELHRRCRHDMAHKMIATGRMPVRTYAIALFVSLLWPIMLLGDWAYLRNREKEEGNDA